MGLFSQEGVKGKKSWPCHDFSPFEILETVVCRIIREKCKEIRIRDEKRKSNLENQSPSSSNNTVPNTPNEEREDGETLEREISDEGEILEEEEEEEIPLPIKKLPHCHIQESPNSVLEERWLHYPKPRSSPSASSPHSTTSPKSSSPTSTTASNDSDHIRLAHPKIINKIDKLSMKRRLYDEIDDYHGRDRASPKKKKKINTCNNKNKSKRVKFATDPIVAPDLPLEFRELIVGAMNGTRLQLLVQKTIFESDVRKGQGRLLLPREQTSSKTFLKRNETKRLKRITILEVPLINPMLSDLVITLGWWKMSSKSKLSYVLKSAWNNVVEKLGLEVDDVVQVWSFRAKNSKYVIDDNEDDDKDDDDVEDVNHLPDDEEGQLHMAIVVVKRGNGGSNSGSSSSGNGELKASSIEDFDATRMSL